MALAIASTAKSEVQVKDSPEETQAFADELCHLYDREYGTDSPPTDVHLSRDRIRRALGFYTFATREIRVYRYIGQTEYAVRATLIHELSHHFQHHCPTQEGNRQIVGPGASHGPIFKLHHWRLRALARDAGMLLPLEDQDDGIHEAVQRILSLRPRGGQYVLDVGGQLAAARGRCWRLGESFEVFLEDCVTFDRSTAYDYIRAFEMNMPPQLNFTTMRFLMRIRDDALRQRAQGDALADVPLMVLKLRYGAPLEKRVLIIEGTSEEDLMARLLAEKRMLERRLAEVNALLERLVSRNNAKVAARKGTRVCRSDNPTSCT